MAEILLTLAIIGAVLGLTIPTLYSNVQQSQFNAGDWTAYTMLSQAVEEIQSNTGILHVGNNDGGNGLRNDLCSVLQCISPVETWGQLLSAYSIPFLYYTAPGVGANDKSIVSYYAGVILSNGYFLTIASNSGCPNVGVGLNECGYLYVDINGAAGPNTCGEDFLGFWVVLNNGVYSIVPMGSPNDTIYGPSGSGGNCSSSSTVWPGCTYTRLFNPNGMP